MELKSYYISLDFRAYWPNNWLFRLWQHWWARDPSHIFQLQQLQWPFLNRSGLWRFSILPQTTQRLFQLQIRRLLQRNGLASHWNHVDIHCYHSVKYWYPENSGHWQLWDSGISFQGVLAGQLCDNSDFISLLVLLLVCQASSDKKCQPATTCH